MKTTKWRWLAIVAAGVLIAACTEEQNPPVNPEDTDSGKNPANAVVDTIMVDTIDDAENMVTVVYDDTTAVVSASANLVPYLTVLRSGAQVSIAQSDELAQEITYSLSGSSTDGGFYTAGAYKATIELNNLTLTNESAVFSGAAIHVQNSKRIKIKPLTGTVNNLVDAAGGSQKGCLYVKGHIEFAQKGTLNVTGKVKHAIKAGEYISIKNSIINVLSAVGDGINCEQFFLMESGEVNISGTADDGLQCDIEDPEIGSTGETVDHEDEDSGNIYLAGGQLTVNVTGIAAKGIKAEGNIIISDGTITVATSGKGTWDTEDLETKAAACLSSDANITVSGGSLSLTSTGSGGKGIKCDSLLTVTGGTMNIKTTGALYYNNGSTENANYTGNTDNIDSKYYSSPKGIKAGIKTESGSGWNTTYTYAGGIVISGGVISVSTAGRNGEGIESKSTFIISDGQVTVNAYDDAINAASDLTINGGLVFARSTNNDGMDANGNVYVRGGVVYAIGASSPEVAIDANSEEQKKLYVEGGTIVAIGGLESGASLSQSCYTTGSSSSGGGHPGGGGSRSWQTNTWYALSYGTEILAFKTPSNGGSAMIVSMGATPTLLSGVGVSAGTEIFDGMAYTEAAVSGGSAVSLSAYTGGGGGHGW